jgi:hypothetical protein
MARRAPSGGRLIFTIESDGPRKIGVSPRTRLFRATWILEAAQGYWPTTTFHSRILWLATMPPAI